LRGRTRAIGGWSQLTYAASFLVDSPTRELGNSPGAAGFAGRVNSTAQDDDGRGCLLHCLRIDYQPICPGSN